MSQPLPEIPTGKISPPGSGGRPRLNMSLPLPEIPTGKIPFPGPAGRPDKNPPFTFPGAPIAGGQPDSLQAALEDASKMAEKEKMEQDLLKDKVDHKIKDDQIQEEDEKHFKEEEEKKHKKADEIHPSQSYIPEKPQYEYPEKLNLAEKTGDSVDKALNNLSRLYLDNGEVRRMAWLRPVAPLVIGFGAGVLKKWGGFFGNLTQAAVVTSILSPTLSLVRRMTGENAFSQFARFANRREDTGLLGRIMHGGESRVLKALFLREDRDMRQLLRLKDQGANLKELQIGGKDRINNLIASGFLAEMKAQMIAEHNIRLSDNDNIKLERMHIAYKTAKDLFYAKVPTRGQQEMFINDILPNLLTNKERMLWAKQTIGITGVGLIKTAALVTLGHVFTLKNIGDFAQGVGNVFSDVGKFAHGILDNVLKPAVSATGQTISDIAANTGNLLGETGKNLATWKDHDLAPFLSDLPNRIGQVPADIQKWLQGAFNQTPVPLDAVKHADRFDKMNPFTPPTIDAPKPDDIIIWDSGQWKLNGIYHLPSHPTGVFRLNPKTGEMELAQ